MSPHDAMFNEVMLADDVTADSGKAAWPPFPGEKPSKQKLISWLDSWEDDLNTGGFAALLRDEIPFDCQKLKPRPLIPVPLDADPVRAASYAEKNAQIQYENDLKRDELDARVLECKNRLAAKLKKAFRQTAPLLLGRLLAAHAIVDVIDGVELQVPDAYDGVAMFRDIKAMLNAREVSQYDLKTYQKLFEKIRDTPLAANVSPDEFSARINAFTVKVNPFLELPLVGRRLSRFILDQLPAVLGSDVRAIVRELDSTGEWNECDLVTARCLSLVEQAYDPEHKAASLAAAESLKKMVESSVKAATLHLQIPASTPGHPLGRQRSAAKAAKAAVEAAAALVGAVVVLRLPMLLAPRNWAKCLACLRARTALRARATLTMTFASQALTAFVIRVGKDLCLSALTRTPSNWLASSKTVRRTRCAWVSRASRSSLLQTLKRRNRTRRVRLKRLMLRQSWLKMTIFSTCSLLVAWTSQASSYSVKMILSWMCSSSRRLVPIASTTIALRARMRRSSHRSGALTTRPSIERCWKRRTLRRL